ncbi:MAG: HAMP domain-containing sensor histidine kinase [Phycisphaerales bacterium]
MESQLQAPSREEGAGEAIAAAIAHEVNNLLTPVVGLADLLQHTDGDQEIRDQLIERAVDRCQRAVAICSLLVDLTKAPESHPSCSLRDALRDAASAVADRAQAGSVSIDIAFDDAGQLGVPRIVAEHVVLNLLLNAIAASPQGSRITISAAFTPASAWHPAGWSIWIKDRGTGLDARSVADINRGGLPQGSKGIGLAVVRMLCQRWGGRLSVDSDSGHGTTFHVELPAS